MPKFSLLGHKELYDKSSDIKPPPGTYDVKLLPDGNEIGRAVTQDVKFTKGLIGNFIDENVRTYRDNPGPGTYQHGAPGLNLDAGTATLKPMMVIATNKDEGYQAPAWAEDFAKTPGPAAYLTDKWMIEQEANKHLKNFPNLGRAMTLAK